MHAKITGSLEAGPYRFGLVIARFSDFITNRLADGATDVLTRHGAKADNITHIWVPGAWELPLACRAAAESDQYDALIAIGCVIRGATAHFEYVAGEATRGSARVAADTGVPVTLGILTTDTLEQAIERAGSKAGNKGADAALAAIEMASLMAQLRSTG